ncbi:MAG: hypothetical protein A2504_13660 [Bdellovibrionales bacterium RIFOXYD12_FULL_39_22]|nr:MAG: hypothetical protein A2385_00385 [Bdellovibrionales bacterium RIFOXYB1_FULL_39_21]OFZ43865.1 MAG: hypothetical protein A2485_05145 [Bdellovibrionales bacterium RIFOXYC12_FULL_39_17]OFZ48801.1 MAG: hypothetical protein A2404_17700 [Bdellovibrionales bacterium RIFOXYC1_FULL_39_130]OFZ69435.1 MAG: hypothetical protein A2451_10830 [Bdellovibrionales bacterium RIFOXYC2_FULL_39_8]OFZ76534.1 MAG: hypothetical protein A2560_06365 [Bdellovibrionales bacterium RIFOXYD1_FULL_39_84]OFZ94768.1 MAG:
MNKKLVLPLCALLSLSLLFPLSAEESSDNEIDCEKDEELTKELTAKVKKLEDELEEIYETLELANSTDSALAKLQKKISKDTSADLIDPHLSAQLAQILIDNFGNDFLTAAPPIFQYNGPWATQYDPYSGAITDPYVVEAYQFKNSMASQIPYGYGLDFHNYLENSGIAKNFSNDLAEYYNPNIGNNTPRESIDRMNTTHTFVPSRNDYRYYQFEPATKPADPSYLNEHLFYDFDQKTVELNESELIWI